MNCSIQPWGLKLILKKSIFYTLCLVWSGIWKPYFNRSPEIVWKQRLTYTVTHPHADSYYIYLSTLHLLTMLMILVGRLHLFHINEHKTGKLKTRCRWGRIYTSQSLWLCAPVGRVMSCSPKREELWRRCNCLCHHSVHGRLWQTQVITAALMHFHSCKISSCWHHFHFWHFSIFA